MLEKILYFPSILFQPNMLALINDKLKEQSIV